MRGIEDPTKGQQRDADNPSFGAQSIEGCCRVHPADSVPQSRADEGPVRKVHQVHRGKTLKGGKAEEDTLQSRGRQEGDTAGEVETPLEK